MTSEDRRVPAPQVNAETQTFWDGARDGRFLIKRCEDCETAHWYPRALCPFCGSGRTSWVEGSGRGEIYSFSVMRRAAPPYAIAYVTLDEGPTMMTNIVDCDLDAIRIGQPVELVFKPTEEGGAVPMFMPSRAGGEGR
jgi:uncharacterized OB-fold protein